MVALRETSPADDPQGRVGAKRTLTAILKRECQAAIGVLAKRFIAPATTISADASGAYDLLHGSYPMRRVNHQTEYRAEDGTADNQAESYFSRFRRLPLGQHHKFGLGPLANDANEAAYREDTRRWSNGEIFCDIRLRTRPHRDWCGDFQGNTRRPERLAA